MPRSVLNTIRNAFISTKAIAARLVRGARSLRSLRPSRLLPALSQRRVRVPMLLGILILFAVTAYVQTRFFAPLPMPTKTLIPFRPDTRTPVVTQTLLATQATAPATSTPRATSTPAPLQAGCTADATTTAARYDLDSTVDIDAHSASTVLRINYRNETGKSQSRIVFNAEPNRKPGVFTLDSFQIASPNGISNIIVDGARLEVVLRKPLDPHCEAEFTINFTVKPGQITQSYVGNIGYFGYTERQMNLALWMPEIPPYVNAERLTPKPCPHREYTG